MKLKKKIKLNLVYSFYIGNETIKQHQKELVDYCHSIFNNGSIISKVIIQYDFIKEIIN